ncbi:type I-E CRISPR-associated endoribonuclease Cas2e [Cellulomonas bogoriensis]|nr:type I-E CRISPR-associated endoribonuclease Cas2e [Cellulomonas bogoriensis]
MVLVLTACPERLRGHLTRWLMEVSAGVFVGHVTKRVRTLLWARVTELIGSGRALLIYTAPGEQRLAVLTHGHHWEPEDHEGVVLMRRPHEDSPDAPGRPSGWSAASRRRKYGRRVGPK